jgi:hypothetical protein
VQLEANGMSHWIFGVTEHEEDGVTFAPEEVFRQRMADGF